MIWIMPNNQFKLVFIVLLLSPCVRGDYDCVCNYDIEKAVYPSADSNHKALGYLYEFDCKPEAALRGTEKFKSIQFDKQIGYIENSLKIRTQVCPGDAPDKDLVTKTPEQLTSTTVPTSTKPSTNIVTTTPQTRTPTSASTTASITSATISTTTNTPTTTTTPILTTTKSIKTSTRTIPRTSTQTSTTVPSTTATTTKAPAPVTLHIARVTWPIGTYGLMQTRQGCPGSNTRWVQGWLKQDTEDNAASNHFTADIQNFLAGTFQSNDLVTGFCIKDTARGSRYDKPWPKGSYCILKHRACPAGFGSGSIYWDDEDSSNKNGHGGAMPDGEYGSNTKIDYCCRIDGHPSSQMILPREIPFVLIRIGNVCQTVRGMHVDDLYIRWDDEDILNRSGRGGLHPFDNGGSKDHLLHFCYYQSAGSIIIG